MVFSVETVLASVPTSVPVEAPFAIYGAGNIGKEICRFLRAQNYPVTAMIDRNAELGAACVGVPIITSAAWKEDYSAADYTLIVGIHNQYVQMPPLLAELGTYGFKRIVTPLEFINLFPAFAHITPYERAAIFWLAPRTYYMENAAPINRLLALLNDETSRDTVERILQFRITGDYEILRPPSIADEYTPKGLRRWAEPMRLVDCGAYDGDTFERFIERGYTIGKVANFEPDMENYWRLAAKKREAISVNFPCGVAAKTEALRFRQGFGTNSFLHASGDILVQCVALDDAIPDFAPTLLKMDVEGGEIEALRGAEMLIRTTKPDMAICLYHAADHLWRIPLMIHEWDLGYQFYIRAHNHNSNDLVMYALASKQ